MRMLLPSPRRAALAALLVSLAACAPGEPSAGTAEVTSAGQSTTEADDDTSPDSTDVDSISSPHPCDLITEEEAGAVFGLDSLPITNDDRVGQGQTGWPGCIFGEYGDRAVWLQIYGGESFLTDEARAAAAEQGELWVPVPSLGDSAFSSAVVGVVHVVWPHGDTMVDLQTDDRMGQHDPAELHERLIDLALVIDQRL